jgi:hypothetical protein
MPGIPALGRLNQENYKFQASLDHRASKALSLKTKTRTHTGCQDWRRMNRERLIMSIEFLFGVMQMF